MAWINAPAQDLSNRGNDFWVGYGHHQFMEPGQPNSQEMVLYFSAEEAADVTVSINGTSWIRNYHVNAGEVIASDYIPKGGTVDARLYDVPPSYGGTGGEGIFDWGIHIHSTKPIVAYAHTFGSASSGATMLMPVETWGYGYVSINSNQEYAANCFSWAYVVADHDNTVVEITPAVRTRNKRAAGVPFTVTLNRGQIYQVIADNPNGTSATEELSGTRFRSIANSTGVCYPIAAFAGSSRTSNKMACGSGGGDNDNQQLFPTQAWGKRYLTAPASRSSAPSQFMQNGYKILVKDNATKVYRNGTLLTKAANKSYYVIESTSTADLIEADKPVMVAQFMSGGNCKGGAADVGDPEMIYLSPIQQGIKRIGFFRNNMENIEFNYLTLIVPNGGTGLSSLRIDGQPLSAIPAASLHTYKHPRLQQYTVVVRRWSGFSPKPAAPPGQCIVQGDSAFTAITYGLGSVESYGYNAGTLINNLNAVSAIHNQLDNTTPQHAYTCPNTPISISALVGYEPTKIIWRLSALAGTITPAVDYTDDAPVLKGTVTVNDVQYYKYDLPGTYQINTAGTHLLPIICTHPQNEKCDHTEEINIKLVVNPRPAVDFTVTHPTGCTLDTVYLKALPKTSDGYTLKSWDWAFSDGGKATGMDTLHRFAPGVDQTLKLSVVTTEGCSADTTKKITIYAPPKAVFSSSPAAICENSTVTYTPAATYEGAAPVTSWYWNLGNGVVNSVTTADAQKTTYANAGNYTIKHVVKLSALCISDTALKVVAIQDGPQVAISYPAGCLPKDGKVVFTNNTTAPGGQTMASHAWNFGDAAATPANPNTSSDVSPSHVYSSFGEYQIRYTARTSSGCETDTVIKATFNLAPAFSFDALAAVCGNVAAFSVAKAKVTNGVPGTGVYKGKGVRADGTFTPAEAGAGIHTVWYVFSATSGCTDSIAQTIEVYAVPQTAFTYTDNTCQGQNVTFTNTSSIASGSIVRWSWDMGNGTTSDKTTGDAFAVAYSAYGNYTVKLATESNRGCKGDAVTQTVHIQPVPAADFTVPDTICMPGGAALFTNKTTIAGSGALTYVWNFGDGSADVTDVNPSHVYTAAGAYTVQLTASSAYGCKHSAAKVADHFYVRPAAAFTAAPAEVCEGAEIRFTDGSTASGGTINKWNWSFGDGTVASTASPRKIYDRAGTFTVTLMVQSARGCASAVQSSRVVVHQQPVIDAGRSFTVKEGARIQLEATANSMAYRFAWTPAAALDNAAVLRPYLTALDDVTYVLTATGEFNCTAKDSLTVSILRDIDPPNSFTPNGDGIHDTWEIKHLSDYAGAQVSVYNRYGQKVYQVSGYARPWDGRMQGKDIPSGTYYYVIHLGGGARPITGSVTIIR